MVRQCLDLSWHWSGSSAQFLQLPRHCRAQCRPVPSTSSALQCPVSPILPADQCLCPVPAALSASWVKNLDAVCVSLQYLHFAGSLLYIYDARLKEATPRSAPLTDQRGASAQVQLLFLRWRPTCRHGGDHQVAQGPRRSAHCHCEAPARVLDGSSERARHDQMWRMQMDPQAHGRGESS